MKKKLAIYGTGNLANIIAENLKKEEYNTYQLIAVLGRSREKAEQLAKEHGAEACTELSALISIHPDIVLEATTPDSLKTVAPALLEAGISMIILSSGALADPEFREKVTLAGQKSGARLYVASGAIGGFDFMQTAGMLGDLSVTVRNIKPPAGYRNAPFLQGRELAEDEVSMLFEGTAAEAIARFPKNVNVAVAAAEATLGADRTKVTVEADPELELNTHIIELEGAFGKASFSMASRPSVKNPGSSEIAAYSVLNLLRKMTQVIVF